MFQQHKNFRKHTSLLFNVISQIYASSVTTQQKKYWGVYRETSDGKVTNQ